MKNDLLTNLKKYTKENGKDALNNIISTGNFIYKETDPKYIPECEVLMICLTLGYHQKLSDANESEQPLVKKEIMENLNSNEGLDLDLCNRTLDILIMTIFETEKTLDKNISEYGSFEQNKINKKPSISLKDELLKERQLSIKKDLRINVLENKIAKKDEENKILINEINWLKNIYVSKQSKKPLPDEAIINEKKNTGINWFLIFIFIIIFILIIANI